MNKKSNLEKLLLELFENEKEVIMDQNSEPEVISAGHPQMPSELMSDDDMASWLAATYGGGGEVSDLNEQIQEETFENIEEKNVSQSISVKI